MSEAENLFGEAHVRRYRETGGAVGHNFDLLVEPAVSDASRRLPRQFQRRFHGPFHVGQVDVVNREPARANTCPGSSPSAT